MAREFGLPEVGVGADAVVRIKSGDRIRVNGNTGLMDILDIQYQEDGRMKEKSICAYSGSIDRASGVIQSNLKSRGQ